MGVDDDEMVKKVHLEDEYLAIDVIQSMEEGDD